MRSVWVILVVALLLVPLQAFAAEQDKKPAPAVDAPEQDRVICKRVKVTGTHFRQRVCQKRSVWEAQREDSQEHARRIMDRPSSSVGSD